LSPENQAICGAMSALADGLRLRLLAEGVEKPEEVEFLRARGCRLYQGFYFAKPMPAIDFPDFAASFQPHGVGAAA
jgi:EAL domain-containing protein (putative c-di-GMP-specific phosphodiesterase class I)